MHQDNLDLGRDLQREDIVDPETFPLDEKTEVYCHLCVERAGGWLNDLRPLTRSSGVFTGQVRCDEDAPTYVCLSCMPCERREFEAFSPEVAAILAEKMRLR